MHSNIPFFVMDCFIHCIVQKLWNNVCISNTFTKDLHETLLVALHSTGNFSFCAQYRIVVRNIHTLFVKKNNIILHCFCFLFVLLVSRCSLLALFCEHIFLFFAFLVVFCFVACRCCQCLFVFLFVLVFIFFFLLIIADIRYYIVYTSSLSILFFFCTHHSFFINNL